MAKILVVDDEPEILMLVKMMLEKHGYDTIEARNGDECLEKLKEKPDVIVLDVMMPGDDGWEVCRKIKKDQESKDIPVILLTVRTSEKSRKKSIEYAGADAHVNKPFEMSELLETVKNLLRL
jgi:CheY-like chemotaxis protein